MQKRANSLLLVILLVVLCSASSFSQTPARQDSTASANPMETIAAELGLLRRSVQSLAVKFREVSDRLLAPETRQNEASAGKQNQLALNFELLTRVEQRAEVLRKQLIELIEKETSLRNRLVQLEEESRPESIDRSVALVGSTRTPEIRAARRRVYENERTGVEQLLALTLQSRNRLEEDVRQADLLVSRVRQRVLPLVEKELDKTN